MTTTDQTLLNKITDEKIDENVAYNIRKNGKVMKRKVTEDVSIESKADGSGIDIYVKENARNAFVYIPVLVTFSGLNDVVYNDFHIGKNASAIIVAGCAVKNNAGKTSRHQGIHRFFIEENAKVNYLEKHYGEGHGHGGRILDPVTEIQLEKNASMNMDTVQIEGVTDTVRNTIADLSEGATLTITEKIMTSQNQKAKTEFTINLNGKNSSTHVVSRSIATDHSHQQFISHLNGYNDCYGHVECDGILKDQGIVDASPEVNARHVDARLVHEATIGKIAGDQLIKLMSLGLTSKEAEKAIIDGFLK